MPADIAFHWWFLPLALISLIGAAVGRFTDKTPPLFRIILIAGLLGGLIFYRLTRKRPH